MIINDIAGEVEKIQLREHRSFPEILTFVPFKIKNDPVELFRFLVAWNSMGKVPPAGVLF